MIFVSAGTQERPFNRLIEGVDSISGLVNETIVIQRGYSTYKPKKCEYFNFCLPDEMLLYIENARLVIAQAGFGIIGNAIRMKKPIILVPREYKYGEAIDKQYELAEFLAENNESIVCVRDIGRLFDAIKSLQEVPTHYDYKTEIPELIDSFIADKML